ncbi:MAG: hypothetical protein ACYDAC_03945 [Candidatus Dormibacteria bacterium]
MRALLSSLIGVPATILVAAGLGIAGVTVVSRMRGLRQPPIRWGHALLGLLLLGCGAGLMALDAALIGVS